MKNVFRNVSIFFIASLLLVACSDDDAKTSESQTETSIVLKGNPQSNLEIYYHEMLESQSYKDFDLKMKVFVDNLHAEEYDLYTLEDQEGLKKWLRENISTTTFIDYPDAEKQLDELETSYLAVFSENENFFKETVDNPDFREQLIGVIGSPFNPIDTPPVTPYDNCVFECINDAVACDRSARSNYAAGIGASGVSSFFNPIIAAAAAVYATVVYNNAQRTCVRALNRCKNAC
ncbi:hypothetical protein GCM10007424_24820 [Flavobacterium suaedae]|uniref:Lipoprotein n=1 Tax=Flavobacterium suaedae TaxID=1767027 RepID=A0ABQ1K010_9FLAO|nr:hypothetical protein [Flavobacterium suaedae]GGB83836.1 hypothetical protein GCM10007424_24820 [Flavobacterium suaedae]